LWITYSTLKCGVFGSAFFFSTSCAEVSGGESVEYVIHTSPPPFFPTNINNNAPERIVASIDINLFCFNL
jgi:hypothetical protein